MLNTAENPNGNDDEVKDEELNLENDDGESADDSEDDESGNDEVVVSIGDEETPSSDEDTPAPEWVKELRKNHRQLQKENRELKSQVQAVTGAVQKPVELGNKPTLEGCDYDAEKFEAELEGWHDRKIKKDAEAANAAKLAEESNKVWQATLDDYAKAKTELKVKDFVDAEEFVKDTFSVTEQGIILQGSKNPAIVVYALGKNPKKAKELSAIKDPIKFARAIFELESQLKVTNRKAPPAPERTVRGSAPSSGTVDSTLDRLRAEADKTGNYTKVMAYKNQLKQKG